MNTRITENEIRPQHLMEGQLVALTIDVGRLLMNADKFVYVNCPACDEDNFRVKYHKYGLSFAECKSCGTLYTNPRPTDKVLEEFYKNSYNYEYWNKHIFPASENARREKIFVPKMQK